MTEVVLFAVAALLIGVAKTSVGGLATISIAIFASLMPARESTAAILLLLIVGDVVAVWHYHREADIGLLKRLIPAVLPGLALGALFLAVVDDDVLRRSIGVLLLVLAALQLVLQWRSADAPPIGHSRLAGVGTGLAAGFATMTANAAGPVMTLYLVARGVEKWRFLGTSAVFFFGVNLCKVPFSIGLGLFNAATLARTALLAPLVVLGAWAGLHWARRLSQARFDQAVLAATVLSALALIFRPPPSLGEHPGDVVRGDHVDVGQHRRRRSGHQPVAEVEREQTPGEVLRPRLAAHAQRPGQPLTRGRGMVGPDGSGSSRRCWKPASSCCGSSRWLPASPTTRPWSRRRGRTRTS